MIVVWKFLRNFTVLENVRFRFDIFQVELSLLLHPVLVSCLNSSLQRYKAKHKKAEMFISIKVLLKTDGLMNDILLITIIRNVMRFLVSLLRLNERRTLPGTYADFSTL